MAFSLMYWSNYCGQCTKIQRKSEQAVVGDRVLRFLFDNECKVVNAHVQASMKDKSYKVQVSTTLIYIFIIITPIHVFKFNFKSVPIATNCLILLGISE